jgi:hypothetical protein
VFFSHRGYEEIRIYYNNNDSSDKKIVTIGSGSSTAARQFVKMVSTTTARSPCG